MPNTYLKVPSIDELHYRQEWMKDLKTMSYNAGYDMDLKGYDKETGTITKTDEEMITWYNNWVNKEPDKYFAYIYDSKIAEPIGEVYYYLDNGIHSMGIVIQDKYRGKGYSYNALLELEKVAFEKNNISELSDIIPLDRIGAIKTFKKAGFVHTDLEKKELVFGKENIAKQLLITKENYLYKLNNKSVKYSWVRNEVKEYNYINEDVNTLNIDIDYDRNLNSMKERIISYYEPETKTRSSSRIIEILKEKLTKMLERIVKLVHIQDSIYIKDKNKIDVYQDRVDNSLRIESSDYEKEQKEIDDIQPEL